jgi:hypothetical protein
MLLIKHVTHECSSVLGQAKTDEIDGISGIISSQESQNTQTLVINQAFFEYSFLSLSNLGYLKLGTLVSNSISGIHAKREREKLSVMPHKKVRNS